MVTLIRSSLFSTASDNCEIYSLCTKTWPQRKIISVIELMGLSEIGEQPREAKEEKHKEKKKGKTTCVHRIGEKRRGNGRKRNAKSLLYCFMIKTEWDVFFFSPHCHDTVADKRCSVYTMGGFGMVLNLIDKAKQWHNACRPITFLFV